MSTPATSGNATAGMRKIRMLVEVEYDAVGMHGDEPESKRWFMENVLLDKAGLLLHSNEIGDTVGTVLVLEVHPF